MDQLVTVPLRSRGFAGEKLTLILKADREEMTRSGVWSQRSNPIYEPEIETHVVPVTGGTGNWIRTDQTYLTALRTVGVIDRNGALDLIGNRDYRTLR
ncbi:hypothetical protein [Adhaeretor mobilis]|uniref:Uncharacterized protein n=1 Tax=Adhaeretor mobilis TaxID=1930276 RepID=A0A517N2X4_9BACT|nr:hypothetical protein [Adhaeretor mobilis]QDT01491.1 hypothetical protein HG15A2_48330 [Adhaeretor mobilis]